MGFDKEEYRENRAAGMRGQGPHRYQIQRKLNEAYARDRAKAERELKKAAKKKAKQEAKKVDQEA